MRGWKASGSLLASSRFMRRPSFPSQGTKYVLPPFQTETWWCSAKVLSCLPQTVISINVFHVIHRFHLFFPLFVSPTSRNKQKAVSGFYIILDWRAIHLFPVAITLTSRVVHNHCFNFLVSDLLFGSLTSGFLALPLVSPRIMSYLPSHIN